MNFLNNLARDKALHMIGGMLIWILIIAFGFSMIIAQLVVLAAAISKELYDKLHPKKHTADLWDIIATISLSGLITLVLYYRNLM